MLRNEVPNVLERSGGSHMRLIGRVVEDLQQVVKDTLFDIFSHESGLLIISQECESIFDQEFGASCYDFNYTQLSDMIKFSL
jgi:hypothetical protein